MSAVGERLKQAREAKGWTQEKAAQQLNVSSMTVSRQERGQHAPDEKSLKALANAYGVTTDWILFGDTRVEKEGPAHPELEAFAHERAELGRPIPPAVLDRLRRELHAWEGKITRDHLVMLMPIATERAEQFARKEPPPLPEGKRRVPPGKPRR